MAAAAILILWQSQMRQNGLIVRNDTYSYENRFNGSTFRVLFSNSRWRPPPSCISFTPYMPQWVISISLVIWNLTEIGQVKRLFEINLAGISALLVCFGIVFRGHHHLIMVWYNIWCESHEGAVDTRWVFDWSIWDWSPFASILSPHRLTAVGKLVNSHLPWRSLAVICVYSNIFCYRSIGVCELSSINKYSNIQTYKRHFLVINHSFLSTVKIGSDILGCRRWQE